MRLRFYLKEIIQPLLALVLLLLASGCREVGVPVAATQPAPPPELTPLASLAPAATFPAPATPTLTQAPPASPTLTETPGVTPAAIFFDENLPLGSHAYVLPLTIRHVSADGASLFFELEAPSAGYLYYQAISPTEQPAQATPLAPGESRQYITLEGLSPGAEYRAMVALQDAEGALQQPAFLGKAWGSVHFCTASGEGPLRVGVFGDAGFGDPATQALVQQMVAHELDFVIHTGDVVYQVEENSGPVEAYALKYYQTFSPLLHRLPVYTIIGNHDYDAAARWGDSYFYYYAFPPFPQPGVSQPKDDLQYYAFAYQDIQFLMLDSQVLFGVSGRESQQAWMVERLADPSFRFTIPVLHVPPFYSGSVHPGDQLPVRRAWHPLFASAQVPLVLSGHSHHYERLQADGITYIVSGGGSAVLYDSGEILPESQEFARRTHFVLMEIYVDRIELSAIDKGGDLFDQAVIALP